jgi:putative hydrolase of the HAD superfamily
MAPDGIRAVLLDVLGTMLELELPWPHLVDELAARGATVSEDDAMRAMLAEIAHYRAHHDEGATPEGLARLRRACAEVVRRELGDAVAELDMAEIEAAMLAAVRFRPYDDTRAALDELRAAGLTLVAVSNWDVSLREVLDDLGLAGHFAGLAISAEAGAPKPSPAIFAHALALAGVTAAEAVHVGDSVDADVVGARAAGIGAVLIDRAGDGLRSFGAGEAAPEGVPTIASLAELAALL